MLATACGTAGSTGAGDRNVVVQAPLPSVADPRARPIPIVEDVPAWMEEVLERLEAIQGASDVDALARSTGEELVARLVVTASAGDRQEARRHTSSIVRNELESWFDDDLDVFGDRALRRNMLVALLRSLYSQLIDSQRPNWLDALRCSGLASDAQALRRKAFSSARDLVDSTLAPLAAAVLGAQLRADIENLDQVNRSMGGVCSQNPPLGVVLADGWYDAGYLLSGDPCDLLSWDLYMYILGKDEERPVNQRVFGPTCRPRVLVFH